MIELLKETEDVPADFPDVPAAVADTLGYNEDLSGIWRRIEAYVRVRWTPRNVVWIVSGEGDWEPPLGPVNSMTVEVWQANAWAAASPDPSPTGGYCLDGETYRFSASVGGGTVPPEVPQAFARLALYCTHDVDHPEHLSAISVTAATYDGGAATHEHGYTRPTGWVAKALQLSGAADLLRTWRRSK